MKFANRVGPAARTVILAAFGGMTACFLLEMLFRWYPDDQNFLSKKTIWQAPYLAHCYPTDPFRSFPLDLRKAQDASAFAKQFPSADLVSLIQATPHCISYSTAENSPRTIAGDTRSSKQVVLIGDSFAFGEGVPDDQTFGSHLARAYPASVRILASSGADLPQIQQQFASALAQSRPGTEIIYLFVLNDPLLTPELQKAKYRLNDLMNVRFEWLNSAQDLNRVTQLLWKMGRWSHAARFLGRRWIMRDVTQATIRWYQSVFRVTDNPPLLSTFDEIRRMQSAASNKGIRFTLVIYPLMVQMRQYPLHEAHQTLMALAKERSVEAIDLLPYFETRAKSGLIVHPLDSHPNGAAHQLAAEALVEALKK